MQELRDVLENYLLTKKATAGKATKVGQPDQVSLTQKLPTYFNSILDKLERRPEFVVEGSFGDGQMASVPWVGVFNRSVTESAQSGYYIVLLFSSDMSSCVLSLNQGISSLRKRLGAPMARRVLLETAKFVQRYFVPERSATLGPIDLVAPRGSVGEFYIPGAIESFSYRADELPTASVLEKHFEILLTHYDALVSVFGHSLQKLNPATEPSYQQEALELAGNLNPGFEEQPEEWRHEKQKRSGTEYRRDSAKAARALKAANFRCEVDHDHITFISRSKSIPYVEAHHLVPISRQGEFKYSLDVTPNITALCPTCHRLLHHGKTSDKRTIIAALFDARREKLSALGIRVDLERLLRMYDKDLGQEEA
jgi:5-methylcytosine-specific restriction protein A